VDYTTSTTDQSAFKLPRMILFLLLVLASVLTALFGLDLKKNRGT
jgi:hypothetical protein